MEEEVNIGAGSTITKDVFPEAPAVARSKQVEKRGKDPEKEASNVRHNWLYRA